MINNIKIDNFKCLNNEDIQFKPLTIITGLNSSGKSTLIQTILFPLSKMNKAGERLLSDRISSDFASLKNKYTNSKEVTGSINNNLAFKITENDSYTIEQSQFPVKLEENCYYLSANRIGVEKTSKVSVDYKVGGDGEFVFATFENEKSTPLDDSLIKDKNSASFTLAAQVDFWLSYITDLKTELKTERRSNDFIEISFNSDGLNNLSPINLGTGVSYLAKIIITCLRAQKDNVIIIENPEIHLHPASQAKLGEFFAFIANAGIQIIIETHCEHLINRVIYEVYKQRIVSDSVSILYKEGVQKPFKAIKLKSDGKFYEDFPEGFFDATLSELIEME